MNTIPKIIAICGYKRSGKDTVANIISQLYGHKHMKIASKLKDVVQTLFGFTYSQIEEDSKDDVDHRWGISPRQAMQFIGTEMFQFKVQELLPDIGRRFWIKGMTATIPENTSIVISDLRFVHEYEELKKLGVYVIRVNRDTENMTTDKHPSECDFLNIPINLEINNTESNIDNLTQTIINQIGSPVDH